jgi:adenylate cyclase class 2
MEHQEIEVKFLNIDKVAIENKLVEIGASKKGDIFYHSCVFDYPGFPLDKDSAWVRLRSDGDEVMLAYKHRLGVTSNSGDDDGMEEVEFKVDSFDKTKLFLLKIGMIIKFEQEKKRTRYVKDNVEFDIDTWPRLNTYLEIESDNMESIKVSAEKLGLDFGEAKTFSATQIYQTEGINDKDYIKMGFDGFVKR